MFLIRMAENPHTHTFPHNTYWDYWNRCIN